MSARETCYCGHDKATHYADEQKTDRASGITFTLLGACLGMRCDCIGYVNENDDAGPVTPLAPPLRNVRGHARHCRCYDCKKALGLA